MAHVVFLANGGIGPLVAKMVSIAVVLLASLMLGLGGLLAHRAVHSPTRAEAPAAPPAPTPPPVHSASKDQAIDIKGHVLNPDGQPLAGAKVYLSTYNSMDKSDPKIPAEADAEGRFVFTASRAEVDRGVMVAAEAPGYGPDWVSLKEARDGKELTLRLVKDDLPIKGRVLDLDGRPVAGAIVQIWSVGKMPGEDLTPYLKELRAKPKNRSEVAAVVSRYTRLAKHVYGFFGSPKSIKTGDDGRFELWGFGRERIVHLFVEGPGLESRDLTVMIHPEVAKGLPLDIHGPHFDHLAAPSKPIRGTVREKGTGKPLAGIRLALSGVPAGIIYREFDATTDERGQYRIDGGAKHPLYTITAGGKPYFIATKSDIADTPGREPLVVDFELERGIEITGRVFDKATGKPLRALISYHARADNPYAKNASALNRKGPALEDIRMATYGDDPFTLIGLPGPGYLFVVAFEDDYRKLDLPEDWKTIAPRWRGGARPMPVHAWVRIDPSEKDPQSTRYEIALEPVKPILGQVHDAEGKPLDGYLVAGLTGNGLATSDRLNPQKSSSFQVRGVGPGQSRMLAFIHPEKKIGKVVTVLGEQRSPLQVRLRPLGGAKGRILGADGQPRSGLQVRPALSPQVKDDNLLRAMSDLHRGLQQSLPAKTDSAGNFRLDGLLPELKHVLWVSSSENNLRMRLLRGSDGFTVESGNSKDLGDFKIR